MKKIIILGFVVCFFTAAEAQNISPAHSGFRAQMHADSMRALLIKKDTTTKKATKPKTIVKTTVVKTAARRDD